MARAGVRHIVKLSQFAAGPDSPVRLLRYHAAVERAIQQSGMAWTFLRPNLFMQGMLQSAVELGRVWMPKADIPLTVYDKQREAGFRPALDVGAD